MEKWVSLKISIHNLVTWKNRIWIPKAKIISKDFLRNDIVAALSNFVDNDRSTCPINRKHPERTKSIFWCTESGSHVFSKMMTATMLSINPTIPKLEHTIAQSMFVMITFKCFYILTRVGLLKRIFHHFPAIGMS